MGKVILDHLPKNINLGAHPCNSESLKNYELIMPFQEKNYLEGIGKKNNTKLPPPKGRGWIPTTLKHLST